MAGKTERKEDLNVMITVFREWFFNQAQEANGDTQRNLRVPLPTGRQVCVLVPLWFENSLFEKYSHTINYPATKMCLNLSRNLNLSEPNLIGLFTTSEFDKVTCQPLGK